MALGAKLNVSFQGRFLAFRNPLDPYNGNPFGLFYFSDILEFVDTLNFRPVRLFIFFVKIPPCTPFREVRLFGRLE